MLKRGAEDIKDHRWLAKIDMKALLAKKIPMQIKPKLEYEGDTSNFNNYPDSDSQVQQIGQGQDPFLGW